MAEFARRWSKQSFRGILLYPFGGFFIWGGDPMATEDFKRKLTAVMSADVVGVKLLGVGAGTYFGEMAS
jgi:hypothetical protein